MSALEISEHPWLGGSDAAATLRDAARCKIAQRAAERAAEKTDRLNSLRGTRRIRRLPGRVMHSRTPEVTAAAGVVGMAASGAGGWAGLAAEAAFGSVGVESVVLTGLTRVQDGGVRRAGMAVAAPAAGNFTVAASREKTAAGVVGVGASAVEKKTKSATSSAVVDIKEAVSRENMAAGVAEVEVSATARGTGIAVSPGATRLASNIEPTAAAGAAGATRTMAQAEADLSTPTKAMPVIPHPAVAIPSVPAPEPMMTGEVHEDEKTRSKTCSFPLIGEDQEVEESSFLPKQCRTPSESVIRRWGKEDFFLDEGRVVGGGTFGESYRTRQIFDSKVYLYVCKCRCLGTTSVVVCFHSIKTTNQYPSKHPTSYCQRSPLPWLYTVL